MNSQKRKHIDCLDRISKLPESIISQILSLLPTKDVLRTSVLARSWEFKWTSIYNVDIEDNSYYLDVVGSDDKDHLRAGEHFFKFVERVVLHSRNVNSFRLWCYYRYNDASPLTACMSALFTQNIENFELTMERWQNIVLPRRLLDCTSLKTLLLHVGCTFKVPVQSFFPNLTALDFHYVHFLNQNSRTDTLVLTFPVLESFKQADCKWSNVNFVEICAPKLTYFESKRYVDYCNGPFIKILGARIKLFATYGRLLENFVLIGTTVLSATLDHCNNACDSELLNLGLQVRKLLRQFADVNHLKLSGSVLKAISLTQQGLPLLRYDQLRQLEVYSPFNAEAVLELLHASAVLRHLVLDIPNNAEDYEYNAIESVPSCIASHMEELKLGSFSGMESQYHLARFFIRNGAMLKRIYVCAAAASGGDDVTKIAPIIEKLSQFPKASACLKIVGRTARNNQGKSVTGMEQ